MSDAFPTFDLADYLDDDRFIAEYLTAAFEDQNSAVFLKALNDVARAKGMTNIARTANLGRESLYKALQSDAQPRFDTIRSVLRALGMKLEIAPAE